MHLSPKVEDDGLHAELGASEPGRGVHDPFWGSAGEHTVDFLRDSVQEVGGLPYKWTGNGSKELVNVIP